MTLIKNYTQYKWLANCFPKAVEDNCNFSTSKQILFLSNSGFQGLAVIGFHSIG